MNSLTSDKFYFGLHCREERDSVTSRIVGCRDWIRIEAPVSFNQKTPVATIDRIVNDREVVLIGIDSTPWDRDNISLWSLSFDIDGYVEKRITRIGRLRKQPDHIRQDACCYLRRLPSVVRGSMEPFFRGYLVKHIFFKNGCLTTDGTVIFIGENKVSNYAYQHVVADTGDFDPEEMGPIQ